MSTAPHAGALVLPLHVPPSIRSANADGGPLGVHLELGPTVIPAGGGIYDVYLIDPAAPSARGRRIGLLGIEGPTAPEVRQLRIYARLDEHALAILRATDAPRVRIVPRGAHTAPLRVRGGAVDLRKAP